MEDTRMFMRYELHITSIYPPEELYKLLVPCSERNRNTYRQLERRITTVVYHWHDESGYHTFEQPMSEYHGYNSIKFQATRNPDADGFAKMDDSEVKETEAIFKQTRIAGI